MTDTLKPKAVLTWNLYTYCPKCGKTNDLASGDHDTEHHIAKHIFTNAWEKLDGWEAKCEHCGHEFQIEHVEY